MSDTIKQSEQMEKYFYRVSGKDFKLIPEYPLAYWLPDSARQAFYFGQELNDIAPCRAGMQTGENDKFVRLWSEVSYSASGLNGYTKDEAMVSMKKWFPYNSGGSYRKWYGNNEKVVDWYLDGRNIKQDKLDKLEQGLCLPSNSKPKNEQFYFKKSITWTAISSSFFGARISDTGALFDIAGASAFPEEKDFDLVAGFLMSKVATYFIKALNPTLNVQPGNIGSLPFLRDKIKIHAKNISNLVFDCVKLEKLDWDLYETSWNFKNSPLLELQHRELLLKKSYQNMRESFRKITLDMQKFEEENNRVFIESYSLENELDTEVDLNQITLTCNTYYRYGNDQNEEELESLLLADTMKELISYGVGCMFGRYSLDKPGLILATQGDGMNEYLKEIPSPSFPIDDDNIIPVLEDDYFTDDIASRFVEFIKVAFGEEHHTENIRFIEDAIGKSIRKYFVKGFYDDHIKRYKKRPIYWMVSSPKKSFNALIYMHRYQDDIFARVQNNYLREYITKLEAAMHTATTIANDESNSAADRRKATKDIETITKKIDELIKFDRDKLTPFAQSRTPIDLDDGVKVNYSKFEEILYPIPGLSE